MLVSYVSFSSTLKMEAKCSSETSADFQWTTWRYSPEDRTVRNDRCENLKSCVVSTQNAGLYDLVMSFVGVRVMKCRWDGHVARMGEPRNGY
jgi:hypothetical protein